MSPRTLASLAGLSADPSPLDRAALVVIDAQREYRDGVVPLPGLDAAARSLGRLLALARARGVPVIHVLHHGPAGAPLFDSAGPFVAPLAEAQPEPGEAVVIKALPNAFAGTDLAARLAALGRPEIILAGFATHMCVAATARAALDLGIRVTVVAAACASRALPDPLGGVIAAEDVHRGALAQLADRFAVVVADETAWAGPG